MAIVGPAAVLVIAAGLAVAGIEMALRSLPATLARLVRGSSSRRLR